MHVLPVSPLRRPPAAPCWALLGPSSCPPAAQAAAKLPPNYRLSRHLPPSASLFPAHTLQPWTPCQTEFYYPALKPWVHYVPSGWNGAEEIDRIVQVCLNRCWRLLQGELSTGGLVPAAVPASPLPRAHLLPSVARGCRRRRRSHPPWIENTPPCRSNLPPPPQFLRTHDNLARSIAANAQRFAQTHLIDEGRHCYLKVPAGF